MVLIFFIHIDSKNNLNCCWLLFSSTFDLIDLKCYWMCVCVWAIVKYCYYAAFSPSIILIVIKCLPLSQRYSNCQNLVLVAVFHLSFEDKEESTFFAVIERDAIKSCFSNVFFIANYTPNSVYF